MLMIGVVIVTKSDKDGDDNYGTDDDDGGDYKNDDMITNAGQTARGIAGWMDEQCRGAAVHVYPSLQLWPVSKGQAA